MAATNPALRIIGPAIVDMAGFNVRCDEADKPQGISVEGEGVKLLNGGVLNCQTFVRLGGEGKHVVTVLAVEGCGSEGVNAVSDNNTLKNLLVLDNDSKGLKANNGAGSNVFTNNVALGHESIDLVDENVGGTCNGNQWKKNVFGTSEAGGTPDPACIK